MGLSEERTKFVVHLTERGRRKDTKPFDRSYVIPAPSAYDAHEWGVRQAHALGISCEVAVHSEAAELKFRAVVSMADGHVNPDALEKVKFG